MKLRASLSSRSKKRRGKTRSSKINSKRFMIVCRLNSLPLLRVSHLL